MSIPRQSKSASKQAPVTAQAGVSARIVLPVRYGAWLSGDLGQSLQKTLQRGLRTVGHARVTLLPCAFLVEADEAPGPLLEAVSRAAREMDRAVQASYPVFHHEMGPVWNGTLQAVFA